MPLRLRPFLQTSISRGQGHYEVNEMMEGEMIDDEALKWCCASFSPSQSEDGGLSPPG